MPKPLPSYLAHRRWTEVEGRAALEALARSKLSLREFAAREGLDPQRLQRWRDRLGASRPLEAASRAAFVEVPRPSPAVMVEVVLARGRIIRVSASVDPAVLRGLVDALDEGSC